MNKLLLASINFFSSRIFRGCEQRSSEPGSGEESEKGVCLRIKAHRVHPLCTRTKDEGATDPAHRRANFLFAPRQVRPVKPRSGTTSSLTKYLNVLDFLMILVLTIVLLLVNET